LTAVLATVAATLVLCGLATNSLVATTLLLMLCFAALGAGNGALFQLVPLRWPVATAVAGSMIGEIGALGGGFIPNAMGLSRQYTGTCAWGFAGFAVCAALVLLMLRALQSRWTRTWVGRGGRARTSAGMGHEGLGRGVAASAADAA
jgi:MFS transporter, NNP family, nitrate/nitrite transporter